MMLFFASRAYFSCFSCDYKDGIEKLFLADGKTVCYNKPKE